MKAPNLQYRMSTDVFGLGLYCWNYPMKINDFSTNRDQLRYRPPDYIKRASSRSRFSITSDSTQNRLSTLSEMEEERPLMPRTGISGDNERIQRRVSLRGALGVFFCALVLFILSYLASRSIFYSSSDTVAVDLAYSGTGLIWPLNGSHPTLTSTSECTSESLPTNFRLGAREPKCTLYRAYCCC